MVPHRGVMSVSVAAAGVMALSACGGGQSTGPAPFTPSSSSQSSSPTTTSKWTPEQEQVIETTLTYHGLVAKYRKGATLDMAALRSVATEARAVQTGKTIVAGLSAGFILYGDDAHEIRSVTITGATSVLTECWIERSYGVNRKASPTIRTKPSASHIGIINLSRSADRWHVSGYTDGAACAAKE